MQRTTYFKPDNKTVIPEDKSKPIYIELYYDIDISTILNTFPWEERLTTNKGNANRHPFNIKYFFSTFELSQKPVKTGDKEAFEAKFTYKENGELVQKVCFLDSEEKINLLLSTLQEMINPIAFQRIEDIMMGRNVERSDKIKTFYTKDGNLVIIFYEEADPDYLFSAFRWYNASKMDEEAAKYLEEEEKRGRKVAGIMLIPSLGPINNIFFYISDSRDKKGYYLHNVDRNKGRFVDIIKHFIPPKYMKSVIMKFEFA